ncbi:MAG: hypothetical protein ACLVJ6_10640 [Merdibacter sp.]
MSSYYDTILKRVESEMEKAIAEAMKLLEELLRRIFQKDEERIITNTTSAVQSCAAESHARRKILGIC